MASAIDGNANSIKNYRDEFDPVFPNARKGWKNREMHPTRVKMLAQYGNMNLEDMYEMLLEKFIGVIGYLSTINTAFQESQSGDEISRKIKDISIEQAIDPQSTKGLERLATIKGRVTQAQYRKWILYMYNRKCCLTGLNIPEILRASHIIAWKADCENRMNPENGLCLSATYDAAFDRHLISFDDDYRMILAPSLHEYYTNRAFQEQFKKLEGAKITMPLRFPPSKALLAKHREMMR